MELMDPRIGAHLDGIVPARHKRLRAMEEEAAKSDFPIIGPAAGHFCYLIARMVGARSVFELGSGFGYSTAWFARAVRENGGGTVHHSVGDEELSARARDHMEHLGFDDVVQYHVGESVAALSGVRGMVDMIFNDIDKEGYPGALDVIERKLRPGGVLITDNLLWHGRVFDESDDSPATRGVRELTRRITTSDQWDASIVPIRDGLLLARKRDA